MDDLSCCLRKPITQERNCTFSCWNRIFDIPKERATCIPHIFKFLKTRNRFRSNRLNRACRDEIYTHIIFSSVSPLSKEDIELLTKAKNEIENIIEDLYSGSKSIAIHADLHGANVFTHRDQIYVFDFDDAGFGLPIQDLAIALYYLDTPEQEAALLAGYQSVSELPRHNKHQLNGLLLQRRIILLNYLYETTNQEHRDMAPEYLVETLRRARVFLDQK